MLYFVCPTCKTLLAHKQIPYEERMDTICKNVKLSHEEMEIEKKKVLNELEVTDYCCRQRFMGYVKLIDEIV